MTVLPFPRRSAPSVDESPIVPSVEWSLDSPIGQAWLAARKAQLDAEAALMRLDIALIEAGLEPISE